MRKMINALLGTLGKIVRVLSMVLRWIFIVLIGGIALITIWFSGLYFWAEIRFNATIAESDARTSFVSYCKSICVNSNEFDGPLPTLKPISFGTDEYSFTWAEHNNPNRTIKTVVSAQNIYHAESEQFSAAHPWTSRVDCQASKELKDSASQ
jgi:hypothetical protein